MSPPALESSGGGCVLGWRVLRPSSAIVRAAGALALLLAASPGLATPDRDSRPSVLVVGIDGADWDVMDPLIEADFLPTLGHLVRQGVRADLSCAEAMPRSACFCPPVWNSIATGQPYVRHHMFGLTQPSSDRGVKAIWDVLAEAGGTSTLLSMRNGWPAESSATYVVTEFALDLAADQIYQRWGFELLPIDSGLTRPPGLLEQLGLLPHVGERRPALDYMGRDRVAMAALERLTARDPTDFTFVLLHSPDKSEHITWGSIQRTSSDPIDPQAIVEIASRYDGPVHVGPPFGWGTVASQYLEIDEWLGRYLQAEARGRRGPLWRTPNGVGRPVERFDYVILVSDHGMTRNYPGVAGLPGQHGFNYPDAHWGILVVAGPSLRKGLDLGAVSVFDVAPTVAYLMGLPISDELPGRILEEAFLPGRVEREPAERVPTWED